MTKFEALICLKAKLRCLHDSNSCPSCHEDCDNCDLNYLQGTIGEQQDALRIAISIMEVDDDLQSQICTFSDKESDPGN